MWATPIILPIVHRRRGIRLQKLSAIGYQLPVSSFQFPVPGSRFSVLGSRFSVAGGDRTFAERERPKRIRSETGREYPPAMKRAMRWGCLLWKDDGRPITSAAERDSLCETPIRSGVCAAVLDGKECRHSMLQEGDSMAARRGAAEDCREREIAQRGDPGGTPRSSGRGLPTPRPRATACTRCRSRRTPSAGKPDAARPDLRLALARHRPAIALGRQQRGFVNTVGVVTN